MNPSFNNRLTENAWQVLKVYVFVFIPLFIVLYNVSGHVLKTLLIANLVTLPVSVFLVFVLSLAGSFSSRLFHGSSSGNIQVDAVRNAELNKLMPLVEKKRYAELLAGLNRVEREYGPSSRLTYYRSRGLVGLGEYARARTCLAEYMRISEEDDEFMNYCRHLLREELPELEEKSGQKTGSRTERHG